MATRYSLSLISRGIPTLTTRHSFTRPGLVAGVRRRSPAECMAARTSVERSATQPAAAREPAGGRLPAQVPDGVAVLLDEQHPLVVVQRDDTDSSGMHDDVTRRRVTGRHPDDVGADVDHVPRPKLQGAVEDGVAQRLVGER